MLFSRLRTLICAAALLFVNTPGYGQKSRDADAVLDHARTMALSIAARSYPEIKTGKLRFRPFRSASNFFKTRFSTIRFFTFSRMRHIVFVNPEIRDKHIPEDAMRGILAHELAHVSYYTRKNRLQLLGLLRLLSGGSNARFERKADLEAILRGYGDDLAVYRKWLYANIPAESAQKKRKNYFAPEEILLIRDAVRDHPELALRWKKKVPLNIDEIRKSIDGS